MIVTCVTPDYVELALRLYDSMPDGSKPTILHYKDQGSWVANTLMKPVVAERHWVERGRSETIWLMDADLVYTGLEPLDPLWGLLEDADMAVCFHDDEEWRHPDQMVSAGVVGFAPTPEGAAAFADWSRSCALVTNTPMRYPEQYELYDATYVPLYLNDREARNIPLKYNARPYSANQRDRMWDLKDEEIVLSHVPASREMKKR